MALQLVGLLERHANLKIYPLVYEARGRDQSRMLESILDAMDKADERLTGVERDTIGELQRVSFALTATKKQHERLRGKLLAEPAIERAVYLPRSGGRLIPFTKAHACGNDFLIVTEEAATGRDWAKLTRRLCARNTGIGADGIEFFAWTGPSSGRIRLHNADGSIAEISGNGTRCVAAWMAWSAAFSRATIWRLRPMPACASATSMRSKRTANSRWK